MSLEAIGAILDHIASVGDSGAGPHPESLDRAVDLLTAPPALRRPPGPPSDPARVAARPGLPGGNCPAFP